MSESQARAQDRNSALPDELLCKILCCLDTQCAVRTTVLSPRWKNLWTCLPDLWFSGDDSSMTFVDRVLFFRDSSNISKLYLKWDDEAEENFPRIQSWICTAITRKVVELHLDVGLFSDDETFELPRNLFTCKTLEVLYLTLEPNIIGNPPKSGCFPNLKVLYVTYQRPDGKNLLLGQVLWYCPVLEDLSIYGYYWGMRALDFNISAPELKRLTVDLHIEDYCEDMNYNFYIDSLRLEVFNLPDGDSSVFSFEINAKSLLKASIALSSCFNDFEGTNTLLDAISNVKQLSLSTLDLKGGVPAFDNLNHLKLTLCGSTCWRYLIEFLQRSRNLEYLVIIHVKDFEGEREDFSLPEVVPVCMLSHLKTITISRFEGRLDEMRVAQYLLKYSEVLNRMTISTSSERLCRAEEKALYDIFFLFERGSKTCQVNMYS